MTIKTYIISSLLILGAFYMGCTMTATISKRNQQIAIANAVSAALESTTPLNCKDNEMLETVKQLAENGMHVDGYQLHLKIGNFPDSDPWGEM